MAGDDKQNEEMTQEQVDEMTAEELEEYLKEENQDYKRELIWNGIERGYITSEEIDAAGERYGVPEVPPQLLTTMIFLDIHHLGEDKVKDVIGDRFQPYIPLEFHSHPEIIHPFELMNIDTIEDEEGAVGGFRKMMEEEEGMTDDEIEEFKEEWRQHAALITRKI